MAEKSLVWSPESLDDLQGVTLEERAKLVLLTMARTDDDVRRAFIKLAIKYHPDKIGGDTERFQLINEAYEFLTKGSIPRKPMLADDELIVRIIGRKVERLIDRQAEWEEYERWRRAQFYEDW